jgi:hypothetical protein
MPKLLTRNLSSRDERSRGDRDASFAPPWEGEEEEAGGRHAHLIKFKIHLPMKFSTFVKI